MTDQLVNHLADVIRRYNTAPYGSGGRRTIGTLILQRGTKRIPLEHKRIPEEWPEGSTVPEDVAEILLSIQFDQKKAVASAFDAAEEVSRWLNLSLSWKEDFKLGAFLISCLVKAGYYDIRDMYWNGKRAEYGLYAKNQQVLEMSEGDRNTSFEPFPKWTAPIDDEGRWLVKPSWPQLKKTFWKPEAQYFGGGKSTSPIEWSHTKLTVDITNVFGFEPTWIKAVHKLESNAYRINQDLLKVFNAIAEDENKAPQKINPVLEKEREDLLRERAQQKRGWAMVDGKQQFDWSDFDRGNRTIEHLNNLHDLQKEQDKSRADKELKPYPDTSSRRYLREVHNEVRKEYWRRWYECEKARGALKTKHKEFHKTLKHCNEVLQDGVFYQRVFLDYRGRMYLSKSVVNYQGGDLQRALIDFAEGKKVRKKDMVHLFTRLGDLYGIKGDKREKEQGARKQEKRFLKWGKNPVKTFDQWKDHGDRWQLIRACIELYALHKNPNYKSTLICEIDQAQSILQHIAMIEGDANLAEKSNLTDTYHDIYSEIAEEIEDLNDLSVGDKRKVVKTALLAWGYGGTAWTACQDYHKEDLKYLVEKTAGERLSLANKVVKAIEKALPAAKRYRKEWNGVVHERWRETGRKSIHFPTSSEFQVHCFKQKTDKRRQPVWQKKNEESGRDETVKLTAYEPNHQPDEKKLLKAMPPNFVHSVDASVMHAVLANMEENESVVSVHDAVGTHLRDVDTVRGTFQMSFVRAYHYENHPLQLLKDDPFDSDDDQETLDIRGELRSQAFRSKHMI